MRLENPALMLILILLITGCSGFDKSIVRKASTGTCISKDHKSVTSTDSPLNVHLSWTEDPSSTMTITWLTKSENHSFVEYGMRETDLASRIDSPSSLKTDSGIIHEATVTGLKPGTEYYYRCGSDGSGWSEIHSFRTAPAAGPFSFAVVGDTQNDRSIRKNIAGAVRSLRPLFVIHCGDVTNAGGSQKLWVEWFEDMGGLIAEIPIMTVMGNHDNYCAQVNGLCRNMFEQFALPDNGIKGASEYWYSFNVAGTHFMMLNSENSAGIKPGSKQYEWLENDLENNKAALNKIAVMHKPPFSMGLHGDNMIIQKYWVPLFDRYGVDVVFSGHEHVYERTKQLKGLKPDKTGTVYMIAGSGGSWVYGCKDNVPERKKGLYEKCEGVCGFVLVDAGYKGMKFSMIAVNGGKDTAVDSRIIDSFEIDKSDTLPADPVRK
ncbi:MAG TPA: fibronectin type III domain-containing protein [Desulfomonilia bacterium]